MIELKTVKYDGGCVTFFVSKQDEYDYKNLIDTKMIEVDDGKTVLLVSESSPTIFVQGNIIKFSVRGFDVDGDFDCMKIHVTSYKAIKDAIEKYNEST